jgi:hypothetical protein
MQPVMKVGASTEKLIVGAGRLLYMTETKIEPQHIVVQIVMKHGIENEN